MQQSGQRNRLCKTASGLNTCCSGSLHRYCCLLTASRPRTMHASAAQVRPWHLLRKCPTSAQVDSESKVRIAAHPACCLAREAGSHPLCFELGPFTTVGIPEPQKVLCCFDSRGKHRHSGEWTETTATPHPFSLAREPSQIFPDSSYEFWLLSPENLVWPSHNITCSLPGAISPQTSMCT